MAGNDDRDRVAPAGAADGARGRADCRSEIAVAAGFAIGDLLHRRPDAVFERRAHRRERQIEMRQLALEISLELARGLIEQRAAIAGRHAVFPRDRDDLVVLFLDRQRANRAGYRKRRHAGLPGSSPDNTHMVSLLIWYRSG